MKNQQNTTKTYPIHVGASIARPFYEEITKNNIKNTHGITLIALVITIIILLIVAGITINLTLGEHGIIRMAEKAGENYINVAEQEKINLSGLVNEMDNILNGAGGSNIQTNPTLASQITANDYGKTINYSANGVNDWKIFYNDGTNVYIIASHYLDMSVTPVPIDITKTKMTRGQGKYTLYWQNLSTNIEAIETLTNTTNWSAFASGKGGESATGGPTYEMLANSWNANPKTNSITLNSTNGQDGLTDSTGLYIPHTSAVDSCQGYWLASTNSNYTDHAFAMLYVGAVYYNPLTTNWNGIRPVVCLKTGTTGRVGYTVTID